MRELMRWRFENILGDLPDKALLRECRRESERPEGESSREYQQILMAELASRKLEHPCPATT